MTTNQGRKIVRTKDKILLFLHPKQNWAAYEIHKSSNTSITDGDRAANRVTHGNELITTAVVTGDRDSNLMTFT